MRSRFPAALCLGLALAVGVAAGIATFDGGAEAYAAPDEAGVAATSAAIDAAFQETWTKEGVTPIGPATELAVVRRVSLALTGTIPSLEELRALSRVAEGKRIDRHVETLLRDRRFADHLAERLARTFVGTDQGPFLVFRRRRFVSWLSDEIADGRPYDQLVAEMVGGNGLWTDKPGTNFITGHARDPVMLTARTTRAFLGMRLDCAQCHDHPFAHWKQDDFAGLAAFYGGIRQTVTGIEDSREPFRPAGRMMMMKDDTPIAEPAVPFAKEALPADGSLRQRLARWLTSADNPAFGKAIANRMWTVMVGRSLTTSGVDDIEADPRVAQALDLLAKDFVDHGHDLRRLIRVISRTAAFRMKSATPDDATSRIFASYPMVKLRAEQIAGALVQLGNLHTIDAESHPLWRLIRFGNRQDFAKRYGDAGEHELKEQAGTIMQRLVMMNGRVVRERVESNIFNAAGRIAALAPNDGERVKLTFLVALTREPTAQETELFRGWLAGKKGDARNRAMEDMLWALVNTTEFSWNH